MLVKVRSTSFLLVRDPGELGGSATKGRDEESEVGAGRLLVV